MIPSYLCEVRVRLLRIDAIVVLDVLEAQVHETAVTALVPLRPRTVHQVLLAQGSQLARFSEVLALQGSCSAEGPA